MIRGSGLFLEDESRLRSNRCYDSIKVWHSWAYIRSIATAAQSEEKQIIKNTNENEKCVFNRWWDWFCQPDRTLQDVKDLIVLAHLPGLAQSQQCSAWVSQAVTLTRIKTSERAWRLYLRRSFQPFPPLDIPRHHFPVCYSQQSEAGVQVVRHPISSPGCSREVIIICPLAHKALSTCCLCIMVPVLYELFV